MFVDAPREGEVTHTQLAPCSVIRWSLWYLLQKLNYTNRMETDEDDDFRDLLRMRHTTRAERDASCAKMLILMPY